MFQNGAFFTKTDEILFKLAKSPIKEKYFLASQSLAKKPPLVLSHSR
jgi:hypothetical protein